MPALKGKWYFKEVLTMPESSITFQSLEASFLLAGTTAKQAIYVEPTNSNFTFYDNLDDWSGGWYVYQNGRWVASEARNITISQPMQVSEEFYKWFTKNAVPLTIEGVWRFNKTLKNNYCIHSTDSNKGGLFKFGTSADTANHWMFDYGAGPTRGYMTYGNINSTNQTIEVYNSIDGPGWLDDSYRTIEIIEPLEFTVGISAIWFYENAHSMELKLYSECYIAETADKIRECANDNTLTFKVSDLADGVQTVYDAGYSKGISGGGGGTTLPTLTNPAATGDVLAGKEYINASGNKKIGTMPTVLPTVDGIDYYGVNYVNNDNKLVLQLGYHQPSGGYMAAGADSHDGPVITDIPASTGARVVPGTADKVAVNAGHYVWSDDVVVAGDSNLVASNIKKDTAIFGITGTYEGDINVGNISVNNIEVYQSPLGDDGRYLQVGLNIPGHGSEWRIYDAGTENSLTSSKIKAGEKILGVTGTYEGAEVIDTTAAAAHIIEGQTAVLDGVLTTGTLPVIWSLSTPFTTSYSPHSYDDGRVILAVQHLANTNFYWPKSGLSTDVCELTGIEPNLKAENIPEGISMFGLQGTLADGDKEVY